MIQQKLVAMLAEVTAMQLYCPAGPAHRGDRAQVDAVIQQATPTAATYIFSRYLVGWMCSASPLIVEGSAMQLGRSRRPV